MGHRRTRTDYTFTPVFTHKRKQNQNPTNHQTSEREGTRRQGSCRAGVQCSIQHEVEEDSGGEVRKTQAKYPEATPIRLPHCSRGRSIRPNPCSRPRCLAGDLDLDPDWPAFRLRACSRPGGEGWGTWTATTTSSVQVRRSIWAVLFLFSVGSGSTQAPSSKFGSLKGFVSLWCECLSKYLAGEDSALVNLQFWSYRSWICPAFEKLGALIPNLAVQWCARFSVLVPKLSLLTF
jgi:hypothetical protein